MKNEKAVRNVRVKVEKPYHHGDLGRAIIEKAEQMLEEIGSESLSLRDVAAALSVSHAAPYRHFPRKLDLLFALAERGFLDLGDAMEKAFASASHPSERLLLAGQGYVKLAMAHPARTQLMFSRVLDCSDAPQTLRAAGQRAFQGLVHIIEDGQMSGHFRRESDALTVSLAAWSMVHGLSSLAIGGQIPPPILESGFEEFVRGIMQQLGRGVLLDP
ncbi:MAG: TetR/AcrR family transcriptional regulator [Spirochaetia bacterium]|nr:TetR/AcrR family transcriptional regulator [Spirochaetia bacterium]